MSTVDNLGPRSPSWQQRRSSRDWKDKMRFKIRGCLDTGTHSSLLMREECVHLHLVPSQLSSSPRLLYVRVWGATGGADAWWRKENDKTSYWRRSVDEGEMKTRLCEGFWRTMQRGGEDEVRCDWTNLSWLGWVEAVKRGANEMRARLYLTFPKSGLGLESVVVKATLTQQDLIKTRQHHGPEQQD